MIDTYRTFDDVICVHYFQIYMAILPVHVVNNMVIDIRDINENIQVYLSGLRTMPGSFVIRSHQ